MLDSDSGLHADESGHQCNTVMNLMCIEVYNRMCRYEHEYTY